MTRRYEVIVLGAGAAGLMCAIEAGKRGCRVALLDHADRAGRRPLLMATPFRPQTNITETVALKYADGKPVDGQYGPQLFFTLYDGRGWYAPPIVGDKLAKLGVQPGQPINVTKRETTTNGKKGIVWEIVRKEGQGPRTELEAPPTVSNTSTSAADKQLSPVTNGADHGNPHARTTYNPAAVLEITGMQMVGVMAKVEAAAQAQLGDDFQFGTEDFRAGWISLFIETCKRLPYGA